MNRSTDWRKLSSVTLLTSSISRVEKMKEAFDRCKVGYQDYHTPLDAFFKSILSQIEQSHLLSFFEELQPLEQEHFLENILSSKISKVYKMFRNSMEATTQQVESSHHYSPPIVLSPAMLTSLLQQTSKECRSPKHLKCFITQAKTLPVDLRERFKKKGFEMIYRGQVAMALLAGGQGTRLSWTQPKGTFPFGPLSQKSLFQIFCEKYKTLMKLTKHHMADETFPPSFPPVYIMTSQATHSATVDFFNKHSFFGLDDTIVQFFSQGDLPAFDLRGKILLEEKAKISQTPNGNGGFFLALETSGILKAAREKSVLGFHVFSIDNPLTKILNPLFLGYSHIMGADIGSLCVEKIHPNEKIGVLCLSTEGEDFQVPQVTEYTELFKLSSKSSENLDSNKLLMFNHGNICNHFFTVDFIERILQTSCRDRLFQGHIAIKKIPYIDLNTGEKVYPTTENGVKLEYFIFDSFPFANKLAALEVDRHEEFAPLKNQTGEDSVDECRIRYSNSHKKWARDAGASFQGEEESYLEISPTLSYEGEDLNHLRNSILHLPCHLV